MFLKQVPPTLEQAVTETTFRLGCAPCVNLFPKTAEPIDLSQARYEYKVVPEVGQPTGYEVYSVDGVTGEDPDGGGRVEYRPFYSVTHPTGTDAGGRTSTRSAGPPPPPKRPAETSRRPRTWAPTCT